MLQVTLINAAFRLQYLMLGKWIHCCMWLQCYKHSFSMQHVVCMMYIMASMLHATSVLQATLDIKIINLVGHVLL